MKSNIKSAIKITPSSVSPVLKTNIVIEMDSLGIDLLREDFSVNVTKADNSTQIKYLRVIEADNDAKTITAKFGGALSGEYLLHIRHKSIGLLSTTGIALDVSSTVTSVSPKIATVLPSEVSKCCDEY